MRFNQKVKSCTLCPELVENRTNVVIGSGSIPCDILFLGEAPGATEDEAGLPFVGSSGQLLRAIVQSVGIDMGSCHILNVIKCRPPDNRNPKTSELANCRPYLDKQIRVVTPKVILALGRYAQAYVMDASPSSVRVMQNIGKKVDCNGTPAILTFHPSYMSRDRRPEIEKAFKMHLRAAKKIVKDTK